MNKTTLINNVATATNSTKRAAKEAVEATIEAIMLGTDDDNEVVLKGFGTFKKVYVAERIMRNPSTGEEVRVPAKYKVTFKAGNTFKKAVN